MTKGIALSSKQAKPTRLNSFEVKDLTEALDVLCRCYASGFDSDCVQSLLTDYAHGTERGINARRLNNLIPLLTDYLQDKYPDCPAWASQAVDRINQGLEEDRI